MLYSQKYVPLLEKKNRTIQNKKQCCADMIYVPGLISTGPEELPVQSVNGGGPEDPHGDGPKLHRHSQRKLQRGKAAIKGTVMLPSCCIQC